MDAFIAKHLQGVSRTYAIVVPMLPEPLADAVGIAYLLMRIVDTLEDAPGLSAGERQACFEQLEGALGGDETAIAALTRPLGESADERDLMSEAAGVFGRVQALEAEYRVAVCGCARAMSAGVCRLMERSAERGLAYPGVRDAAELREYCYYVAGVVGEMLCTMMAHYLRMPGLGRLGDVAVELGIGLQMVNILKDALKDSTQGRRYLPLTEGGDVAQTEVYKAVLHEARQSLQRGVEFVLALPAAAHELRSFCGLPIAWGAMTLARADQDTRAAKIGRGAIQSSIERFGELVADDQSLRQWLLSLLWPSRAALPA